MKVQEPDTRVFLDLKGQKLMEARFYKIEKEGQQPTIKFVAKPPKYIASSC